MPKFNLGQLIVSFWEFGPRFQIYEKNIPKNLLATRSIWTSVCFVIMQFPPIRIHWLRGRGNVESKIKASTVIIKDEIKQATTTRVKTITINSDSSKGNRQLRQRQQQH